MVVEKKKFVVKNLKKREEMAEWFKAADCKSVENILLVGSNPAFFKISIYI